MVPILSLERCVYSAQCLSAAIFICCVLCILNVIINNNVVVFFNSWSQKLETKSLLKLNFAKNNDGTSTSTQYSLWYRGHVKNVLIAPGCLMSLWRSVCLSFCLAVGKYHCPVLYNVFTNNSYIVANKVTGNVFSHEVGDLTSSAHTLQNDNPHGFVLSSYQ